MIKVRLVGVPHPAIDADPTAPSVARSTSADGFDAVVAARKAEADAFYAAVIPGDATAEEALVARQAFAGLLWGKQFFHYDVEALAVRRSRPAAATARPRRDPQRRAGGT